MRNRTGSEMCTSFGRRLCWPQLEPMAPWLCTIARDSWCSASFSQGELVQFPHFYPLMDLILLQTLLGIRLGPRGRPAGHHHQWLPEHNAVGLQQPGEDQRGDGTAGSVDLHPLVQAAATTGRGHRTRKPGHLQSPQWKTTHSGAGQA